MTNTCSPSTDAASWRQTLAEELRPELFRALGDPTRVAILCRLAGASGPLMVSEISDCCGVHLSGVSRHLSTLRDAGVVRAEREGREVRYTLDCELLSTTLRRLAAAFEGCRAACCQGEIQP
jgi:ArsR family transcriptional regulator